MTTEVVVDNIPLMKFRGPGAAVYVGQKHTLGSLSLSFCLSFSFFVGLLTFCIPLCVSVFSLTPQAKRASKKTRSGLSAVCPGSDLCSAASVEEGMDESADGEGGENWREEVEGEKEEMEEEEEEAEAGEEGLTG